MSRTSKPSANIEKYVKNNESSHGLRQPAFKARIYFHFDKPILKMKKYLQLDLIPNP